MSLKQLLREGKFRRVSIDEILQRPGKIKPGTRIALSGTIYTARDQAHHRLVGMVKQKKKLPLDLSTAALYYCGPSPLLSDGEFGACGPTTAGRMDRYMKTLFKAGLRLTIGKGNRSPEVIALQKKYKALYLSAFGGLGALYGSTITSAELIAFPDLGPEAIYRLEVENFPVIV